MGEPDGRGGAAGGGSDGGVVDGGAEDGGAADLIATPVDAGVADGGTTTTTTGPPPFDDLNHAFICSDALNVGASTTYTFRVEGLTNNQTYQFLVVGIDEYGNAAVPSSSVSATPLAVEDFYRRFRALGGAQQGFCFIATAAHGSYESEHVRVLRRFRDEVLLPTESGRRFVAWYYRVSPPAAAWIAERPAARAAVRAALWPAIGGAALWLHLPGWARALVSLLVVLGIARRLLRRSIRAAALLVLAARGAFAVARSALHAGAARAVRRGTP